MGHTGKLSVLNLIRLKKVENNWDQLIIRKEVLRIKVVLYYFIVVYILCIP